MTTLASYLLVLVGVVVGAALVLAVQLLRRTRADRAREDYFRDVVQLARRGR